MSDVRIQIEAVTKGFRDAEQQMRGLGSSVQSVAGSVKALLGLELASYLASAASGALEFAKAGDEARRVASAFVGDMKALRTASAGAVDDTSLQKMDQLARSVAEATGVTQDLNAVLLVASDRFAKGLGGSVGENATAILNGEAEAMRKLGIVIDMADSRLVGLDETRKKAMITQIAAAEAANVDRAAIEGGALSFSQASTAIDNLVSDIQVMAAEFLQSSGVMDIVREAVTELSHWFAENKELIQSIASKGLKMLTTGLKSVGPALEVAADFALLLADGIVTIASGIQDLQQLLNPFSDDTKTYGEIALAAVPPAEELAAAIAGQGDAANVAAPKISKLTSLITDVAEIDTAGVVASAREEYSRFSGDLESFNRRLEETGQLTTVQVSVIEELGKATDTRDKLALLVDEMDRAAATGNIEAYDRAAAAIRGLGFDASDTAFELAGMNSAVASLTDFLFKLGNVADDSGGKIKKAKDETKALIDLANSVRNTAETASATFGVRLSDETRNQQLLQQREMAAAGAEMLSSFSAGASGLVESVTAAWGGDSWTRGGGILGNILWGEDPDTSLLYLQQFADGLGHMSTQWALVTEGMGGAADTIDSVLVGFHGFSMEIPNMVKASEAIARGSDNVVASFGQLATSGLSAMGAFTAGLIDDQKVQAGIMAAIETAQALASWPDPIGMATHFASAALFGAVAAGAFDSAGGGGGARGAAQAGAAFGAPTMASPFDAGGAGDTKETTVIQLQVDGRAIAETTFGGANELNSTFRRPQQLQANAVGAGRKQLF